jgi:hypothetical protein
MNFIMSNGEQSNLPIYEKRRKDYKEVRINPVGAIVKKVVVSYWDCGDLKGVQFYDKDDTLLLEAGDTKRVFTITEIILEEGQRLIGVKSRFYIDGEGKGKARLPALRFIIGWQE